MKKNLFYIISISVLVSLAAANQAEELKKKENIEFEKGNYAPGEELKYRLHWGPFNAGRATISVSNELEKVNNKSTFNIAVVGRTVGLAEMSIKIRDSWKANIDTGTFLPLRASRDIAEGKYLLKEEVLFDQDKKTVKVTRKHPDRNFEYYDFTVPENVQDIIGGFYQLRRVNFNKLTIGDTVVVKAFFDKENFNFRVRYKGKVKIDTDAGEFNAIKIVPLMPKNKLFDGEESVVAYISDDKNKIPLKAEVKMFVGKVKLELTDFKGLKNKVNIIPD